MKYQQIEDLAENLFTYLMPRAEDVQQFFVDYVPPQEWTFDGNNLVLDINGRAWLRIPIEKARKALSWKVGIHTRWASAGSLTETTFKNQWHEFVGWYGAYVQDDELTFLDESKAVPEGINRETIWFDRVDNW